ncbi:hypothetical protein F2P81_006228 [Scophthalmus maximus]|uniref:Uncharacterized protein n=1 Tax=Scophthalmus maximus TaxID=52904 RepID=A0A6A4T8T6_SCOMX|nr:hypothetical protein F2P81_006228 [Scophthalmus maximus]
MDIISYFLSNRKTRSVHFAVSLSPIHLYTKKHFPIASAHVISVIFPPLLALHFASGPRQMLQGLPPPPPHPPRPPRRHVSPS